MPKQASIPELGLVGTKDFCKRIGVAYPTFQKLKLHPEFPKPLVLGNSNMHFWRESDIKKFIKAFRG